jgi:YHS domain-containing protein
MSFDAADAAASTKWNGRTYYFCAERCRRKFEDHSDWYVATLADDEPASKVDVAEDAGRMEG